MSPERIVGTPVDRRSDIFTVGIVLWELLTSTRLFFVGSEVKNVQAVLGKRVVPPAEGGFASQALNEIVLRALERAPSKRFQSCDEFALALEATMSLPKAREVSAWLMEVAGDRIWERLEVARRIEAIDIDEPAAASPTLNRLLAKVAEGATRVPATTSTGERIAPGIRHAFSGRATMTASSGPSLDSAVTQLRPSSRRLIDEIRSLYVAGEITSAMARAKTVPCPPMLAPSTILRANVVTSDLMQLPLDHESAFLFSRIDGVSDVRAILNVAAMPESQTLHLLEKLIALGALSIAPKEVDDERTDIDGTDNDDDVRTLQRQ